MKVYWYSCKHSYPTDWCTFHVFWEDVGKSDKLLKSGIQLKQLTFCNVPPTPDKSVYKHLYET